MPPRKDWTWLVTSTRTPLLDATVLPPSHWALDGGAGAPAEAAIRPDPRGPIAAELRAKTDARFLPEGIVIAGMPPGRFALTGRCRSSRASPRHRPDSSDVILGPRRPPGSGLDRQPRHVRRGCRHGAPLPEAAVPSDGWELDTDTGGHPHPRHFGTFARAVGQYVTRRQVLGLEDAVRKMTSLPAGRIGLTTRGTLAVDNHADVAVFDPLRFVDAATSDDPKRYAAGIRHVLVDGAVAWRGRGRLHGPVRAGAAPDRGGVRRLVVRRRFWSGVPARRDRGLHEPRSSSAVQSGLRAGQASSSRTTAVPQPPTGARRPGSSAPL